MSHGPPPLGVVLAGGASRRMGTAKAAVAIPGGTLIDRPLATLAAAGLDAVVVAKEDSPLPPLSTPRWTEPAQPRHPLCGIVAALERHAGPVVVLACDLPFVPESLVRMLAATAARAVVPAHEGGIEPLVARYEPDVLDSLRAALERELPLRDAVSTLDPLLIDGPQLAALGDPSRMFANVNRPRDLDLLRPS